MEVEELSTKESSSNDVAVKYLGCSLIILILGIVLCYLASLGYNTYIRVSQEKIEVHTTNSNSQISDQEEWAKLVSLFLYL